MPTMHDSKNKAQMRADFEQWESSLGDEYQGRFASAFEAWQACALQFAEKIELLQYAVKDGQELNAQLSKKLAAAQADNARMAWQPIETAPKGEFDYILVYNNYGINEVVWVAEYDCWCIDTDRQYHSLRGDYPTHWMPLPPAPTNQDV